MLRKPRFPFDGNVLSRHKQELPRRSEHRLRDCIHQIVYKSYSLLMIDQKGPAHYWPWYPWTESPRLYRKVNENTMENKTVSSIPQCFLLLFLLLDSKFDFLHWLPFIINYEWKMKTVNQMNPFRNKLCLINVLLYQWKSKQGRSLSL